MSRATPTIERRLLNYKQVATYLGISLRGANQLAADGDLLKVLIGNRVLFDVRDVDDYIERIKRSA